MTMRLLRRAGGYDGCSGGYDGCSGGYDGCTSCGCCGFV